MWHAYGNANGDGHIHSDGDCDGNSHIHADSDCHGNSYAYTDSNAHGDGDIYCNGYGDCDSHSNGYSDRTAAAYTDATATTDTAASSLALFRLRGTRENELASSQPEVDRPAAAGRGTTNFRRAYHAAKPPLFTHCMRSRHGRPFSALVYLGLKAVVCAVLSAIRVAATARFLYGKRQGRNSRRARAIAQGLMESKHQRRKRDSARCLVLLAALWGAQRQSPPTAVHVIRPNCRAAAST